MIPYILAENPKISRKDAFFLSKQLMNKNKWRVFLLDCSFLGWKILSILTLGILDFIFVNPYITGCKAELYASLRRDYVLSRSPRYEMLSDSYLEHVLPKTNFLSAKLFMTIPRDRIRRLPILNRNNTLSFSSPFSQRQ